MLLQRAVRLEQQREVAAARLNTLMGRPDGRSIASSRRSHEGRAARTIRSRRACPGENDPMLKRELSMVERNKVAISMAQKEYIPDLSAGYMYQQRPGMPDMHGMQFTVNLPIFTRRNNVKAWSKRSKNCLPQSTAGMRVTWNSATS